MSGDGHVHSQHNDDHVPSHVLKKSLWETFDGLRFLHGAFVETFQDDKIGQLPNGWQDVGRWPLGSTSPDPSAIVVKTTDAWGHPTKALQILGPDISELPITSDTTGIYRPIELAKHYETKVDVRIDKFSDVTDFDCGCPANLRSATDTPAQIAFGSTLSTPDISQVPWIVVYASSRTEDWRMLVYTDNVKADIPLGVPVTLGKWYGVDFEVDRKGTAYSIITDTKTGMTLSDITTDLTKLGNWDPKVDGALNTAIYSAIDLTAVDHTGSAVIDNIFVSGKPIDGWMS